ncbi:MAG: hypothetical protein GWM90_00560, partial [Gemmatimonadetes bacterium]|nr:hypothetical protein [Gemmatimonadota bacterium]NIQ52014.1 hypothetical protein [Gemmatimonadota bacterium]NIU72114.1 hypothetical protein [Gammaproteobacteria bacterium]NIX42677.1 hypothetical protein [Gemmatimonadota bacterium]NIY06838.1 hypothetical protein [Gemmatimonadota bacterium]
MMSFDGALRGLAGELDLPEPVRSRVLLELRSDLEAMGAALLEEGLPPEEARRRTLEALFPSAAALAELRAFHRP